ncbi:multiple coagulation factor deficiency protein 2 homolog isoform X2 [Styela clava]
MKITIFTFVVATFVVAGTLADEFQFDPDSDESKVHLQEDLAGHIDKKVEEMNQDELQFHYFRQHDYDKNERLDGIELMSKLLLSQVDKQHEGDGGNKLKDEFISKSIDSYLDAADLNKDGFINFAEYKKVLSLKKK